MCVCVCYVLDVKTSGRYIYIYVWCVFANFNFNRKQLINISPAKSSQGIHVVECILILPRVPPKQTQYLSS